MLALNINESEKCNQNYENVKERQDNLLLLSNCNSFMDTQNIRVRSNRGVIKYMWNQRPAVSWKYISYSLVYP